MAPNEHTGMQSTERVVVVTAALLLSACLGGPTTVDRFTDAIITGRPQGPIAVAPETFARLARFDGSEIASGTAALTKGAFDGLTACPKPAGGIGFLGALFMGLGARGRTEALEEFTPALVDFLQQVEAGELAPCCGAFQAVTCTAQVEKHSFWEPTPTTVDCANDEGDVLTFQFLGDAIVDVEPVSIYRTAFAVHRLPVYVRR